MDIPVTLPGMEGQNLALRTAGTFAGPKLLVNGQPVAKQNGTFNLQANSGSTVAVKFKARLLDPIPNLVVGGQTIQIAPPLEWYQYLWMSVPILLVFMGGAIGGFCGGAAAFMSGHIFRSHRSEMTKYALTGMISLSAFVVYFVLASTLLAALHK
jgi:hypothetical protein